MGVFIAQLFWPVWLIMAAYGHSHLGMALGVITVCCGWAIWWRIEFGEWSFWKRTT